MSEKLYFFGTSEYHKIKKPILFYDISELGWARYLSAHINYITKNGKKVAICCDKERETIYRGFATEILPIPKSYKEQFGNLVSASHNLHDPNTGQDIKDYKSISKHFIEEYPDYEVIPITDYSFFHHERIFEPYHHTQKSEKFCTKFRKTIMVFPRYRSSRFAIRNISEEKWIYAISKLCEEFPNLDIVSIGGVNSTLNINLNYENYYNLVPNKDNLDILVALCNMNKVIMAFGTQSGILHVATTCKATTYMIGSDELSLYGPDRSEKSDTQVFFHKCKWNSDGYIIDMKNVVDDLITKIKDKFEYYSEFKVDKLIREKHFSDFKKGIMVEVGAGPPVYLSVSKHFRDHGWRCICIEPNPKFYEEHKKLGNEIYQYACSDEDFSSTFQIVNRGGVMLDEISMSAIKVKEEQLEFNRRTLDSLDIREIQVEIRRLNTILEDLKIEHVDFLSVDTEGWELEVMGGFDVNKYKPKVIMIEDINSSNKYSEYMDTIGYKFDFKKGYNYIYVRK